MISGCKTSKQEVGVYGDDSTGQNQTFCPYARGAGVSKDAVLMLTVSSLKSNVSAGILVHAGDDYPQPCPLQVKSV